MEALTAVACLAALAQESRLAIFRLLVQAGHDGLCVGDIAERLRIPGPTLSFHLKELSHSGLVQSRQQGRFVIYSAHFEVMNDMLAYLTENCCQGESCAAPANAPKAEGVEDLAVTI